VARHRYALLALLCGLLACAALQAGGAFAAAHGHAAGYRHSAARRHKARHASCGSSKGKRSSHRPARRASFRTGVAPRRHPAARCHRRHAQQRHVGRRHAPTHKVQRHRPAPSAAHSSTCANADLTPSSSNLDLIRAATLCLVNRERAGNGEAPLSVDHALECAAQRHSEDMASRDYFDHVGPGGDTPVTRMRSCGYLYNPSLGYEVGENIAWGTLWLGTPRAIVAAWMASPGHRANILDASYRDTAIGVSPHPIASLAHGQPGAIYTQDFGVIFG
jgi:uncharacterized protein YkwD